MITTPVLRHSAALLEGRSGAAALLGSSRAMVPTVLSAVDGRMKTIALPQHEKARRPRGRRRCVGPNLARLGHRRGAEGAHVHAHDDCCKRCAAAIGRKIFPRIIECGAASRGGYSCVRTIHNFLRARQCPESYEAQHDRSLFNTGQECHRLVDTAHCAPLGCAARKARRALPGQKARRAAEA